MCVRKVPLLRVLHRVARVAGATAGPDLQAEATAVPAHPRAEAAHRAAATTAAARLREAPRRVWDAAPAAATVAAAVAQEAAAATAVQAVTAAAVRVAAVEEDNFRTMTIF